MNTHPVTTVQRTGSEARLGTIHSFGAGKFDRNPPDLPGSATHGTAGAVPEAGRGREFPADNVLERLTTGLIVFDPCGEILYANPAAHRILKAAQGVALNGGMGARPRIVSSSRKTSMQLAAAFDARPGQTAGVLLDGRQGIVLKLAPQDGPIRMGQLYVLASEPDAIEFGWVSEAFDLSAAEARALQALARFDLSRDAAAELGISSNTMKDHLAAIYAKTGCCRKAQLFRMIGAAGGSQSVRQAQPVGIGAVGAAPMRAETLRQFGRA